MQRYTANMTPAARARYEHYQHHTARLTITARHYDQLVQMLEQAASRTTRPMSEWLERYQRNGWSGTKFRWDWLQLADTDKRRDWFDEVYDYAFDQHIDSALTAACKEFGLDTAYAAAA